VGGLPRYEPALLEDQARFLQRRAASFMRGAIVVGAVFGGLVGATPLTSLVTAWAIPSEYGVATVIAGVALGALVGFVLGEGRARQLRVQVQLTLCALRAERTLDLILERLDAQETLPEETRQRVTHPARSWNLTQN
jgi:hypothetical protein